MKPLTRYAMGTGMNIEPHMAPWPEGKYYRVDQVDARIAELEAELDAANKRLSERDATVLALCNEVRILREALNEKLNEQE